MTERPRIVVAGGGVAALEALIAVAELLPGADVRLVAPGPEFVMPGMRIGESFAVGRRARVSLRRATDDFGAAYVPDRVTAVDPVARTVACATGAELRYDSLILALGARPEPAYADAEVVGDDGADAMLHGILADLEEGYLKRVAFVVPGPRTWTLPLYELALLAAADAWSMGIDDAQLTLVTPEPRPLALFGPWASQAVGDLLAGRGIEFAGAVRAEVRRGAVLLTPGERRLDVQRVFALPLLRGPGLPGLPCDEHGFVEVDLHGRVRGFDGVFAAGDMTTFPVKQGGIAAQQAEVVAQAVAARHGRAIAPAPFRPVLRGRLLTGDDELCLYRDIAGGTGEGIVGRSAEWWPPYKSATQRLGRYLFGLAATQPVAG
jgi:sulfide:quinone oxidoreductase